MGAARNASSLKDGLFQESFCQDAAAAAVRLSPDWRLVRQSVTAMHENMRNRYSKASNKVHFSPNGDILMFCNREAFPPNQESFHPCTHPTEFKGLRFSYPT